MRTVVPEPSGPSMRSTRRLAPIQAKIIEAMSGAGRTQPRCIIAGVSSGFVDNAVT